MTTGAKLSVGDETKPFVLIAAVVVGIVVNRVVDGRLAHLAWVADIAVFAVMAFVEVKDVGGAFGSSSPRGSRSSRTSCSPRPSPGRSAG